ncbi:MAG: hypothetical protein HYU36_11065 [Planctomycetes bacterium]|nr:hypothetical protein [Planctomycetota bacterium]
MQFALTAIIAACLTAGMVLFHRVMMGKVRQWEATQQALTGFEMLLARAAILMASHWALCMVLVLAFSFGLAALLPSGRNLPGRREEDRKGDG